MFQTKGIICTGLVLITIFLASCASTKDAQQTDAAATAVDTVTMQTADLTQTDPVGTTAADAGDTAPAEAPPAEKHDIISIAPAEVMAAPTAAQPAPAPSVAPSAKSAKKTGATPAKNAAPAPDPNELKLRGGTGNPTAGQEMAELCTGCHGEDGNSPEPLIPKLAGQYGKYIAKQVRNYQAGVRSHQIMGQVAASVSDEMLADISAYFTYMPMMKGDTPSSNPVGKNLFEKGDLSRMMVPCGNCHGATGRGQNPGNSTFPVIGGQHKDYLRGQILSFREGRRNNSPGGVMNIIVQKLTDAEVEALAEYIAGM